jgi:hypothetical protein
VFTFAFTSTETDEKEKNSADEELELHFGGSTLGEQNFEFFKEIKGSS